LSDAEEPTLPLPLSSEGFDHIVKQHWQCMLWGRRLLSGGFVCSHGGFVLVTCECDPNAGLFVVPMTGRELCEHAKAVAGFVDEADEADEEPP
jgi:hypothetical protein